MARTGENETKAAQAEDTAEKKQTFATGQAAIGNYNAGEGTLERGGQIGANPYLNPQYLASVNRLQAGSLDAENNAAKNSLRMQQRRSGGMNSSSTTGATTDLALQKMRLADQLSSQRTAGDFGKNLNWQQQLLQARLAPAGIETPYYGTATSGQNASDSTLSQFGLQSQAFWNGLAQQAVRSAGSVGSAYVA